MKIREKASKELVGKLHREGSASGAKAWKAVAKGMNRPRKRRFEVNLTRIEKYA